MIVRWPLLFSLSLAFLLSVTLRTTSSTGQTLHVPLHNADNVLCTGQLYIGTPLQGPFRVAFDTGSSDLWVLSSASPDPSLFTIDRSAGERASRSVVQDSRWHLYSSSLSSTHFTPPLAPPTWSIDYGEGSARGFWSVDVISFNASSRPLDASLDDNASTKMTMRTSKQTLGEAVVVSPHFLSLGTSSEEAPVMGVLGLGFKSFSESGSLTFIDSLAQQGVVSSRVFSFDIKRVESSSPSTFLIGSPDARLTSNGISWHDVQQGANQPQQWLIHLGGLVFDHAEQTLCRAPRRCSALFDSGTSFIGLPSETFFALRDIILHSRTDCTYDRNMLEISCVLPVLTGLPDIAFIFNNKRFVLTPQHYMIDSVVGVMQIASQTVGDDAELLILGTVFLTSFYTVFDVDTQRIGLALPVHTSFHLSYAHLLLIVGGCLLAFKTIYVTIHLDSSHHQTRSVKVPTCVEVHLLIK